MGRNIQLGETDRKGFGCSTIKGKEKNCILSTGFHTKQVGSTKDLRRVVGPGRTTDETSSTVYISDF